MQTLAAIVRGADPLIIVDVPHAQRTYAELRARIRAREHLRAVHPSTIGLPWRSGLSVAILLLVLVTAVLRSPVTLQADALLGDAVAAERETVADRQSALVEVTPVGFGERAIGAVSVHELNASLAGALLPTVRVDSRATVGRVLGQAPLGGPRAFSAAAYQEWRAALPGRRDTVTTMRDGRWLLRTTNGTHSQYGELVLERATYRVVRVTYVSDGLRVDVRERGYWPAPRRASVTVNVVALDPAALDLTELEARRILHVARADLGRHVHISRERDRVRISGAVLASERTALNRQLAALPRVVVTLDARAASVVPPPGLRRWQERVGGDRALVAGFAEDATAIAQRIAALRDLAQRYPVAEVTRLTPESRRALDRLAALQYSNLVAGLRDIRPTLSLMERLRGPRPLSTRIQLPADWRVRSRAADVAVRTFSMRVDELLRREDIPALSEDDAVARSYAALCDAVYGALPAR